MPRPLIFLVAVVLIPCLIADPAIAAGFFSPASPIVHLNSKAPFDREALLLTVAGAVFIGAQQYPDGFSAHTFKVLVPWLKAALLGLSFSFPLTAWEKHQQAESQVGVIPKWIDVEAFRNRILALMQGAKGNALTPRAVAEQMGVGIGDVQGWMDGKRFPRLEQISLLAAVLRTSVHFLLTGKKSREAAVRKIGAEMLEKFERTRREEKQELEPVGAVEANSTGLSGKSLWMKPVLKEKIGLAGKRIAEFAYERPIHIYDFTRSANEPAEYDLDTTAQKQRYDITMSNNWLNQFESNPYWKETPVDVREGYEEKMKVLLHLADHTETWSAHWSDTPINISPGEFKFAGFDIVERNRENTYFLLKLTERNPPALRHEAQKAKSAQKDKRQVRRDGGAGSGMTPLEASAGLIESARAGNERDKEILNRLVNNKIQSKSFWLQVKKLGYKERTLNTLLANGAAALEATRDLIRFALEGEGSRVKELRRIVNSPIENLTFWPRASVLGFTRAVIEYQLKGSRPELDPSSADRRAYLEELELTELRFHVDRAIDAIKHENAGREITVWASEIETDLIRLKNAHPRFRHFIDDVRMAHLSSRKVRPDLGRLFQQLKQEIEEIASPHQNPPVILIKEELIVPPAEAKQTIISVTSGDSRIPLSLGATYRKAKVIIIDAVLRPDDIRRLDRLGNAKVTAERIMDWKVPKDLMDQVDLFYMSFVMRHDLGHLRLHERTAAYHPLARTLWTVLAPGTGMAVIFGESSDLIGGLSTALRSEGFQNEEGNLIAGGDLADRFPFVRNSQKFVKNKPFWLIEALKPTPENDSSRRHLTSPLFILVVGLISAMTLFGKPARSHQILTAA